MDKRLAALKPVLCGLGLFVTTCAVLYPFARKAFHIDDPLFLWSAQRILDAPFDFYGLSVNWEYYLVPMPEVMKNPPLSSYYIALASVLSGGGPFDEETLHFFFMIPAAATVVGTYVLAKRFTQNPVLAALSALLTPAFLVSSTTVMCDVLLVALWVWAVVLWMAGNEKGSGLYLFLAALLITLSALTKYFGMNLMLLVLAYSIFARHPIRRWAPFLLIPIAALAGYQWLTYALYGKGLLMDAASYATDFRVERAKGLIEQGFITTAFTGGITMLAFFFAPLIWGWKRALLGYGAASAIIAGTLIYKSTLSNVAFNAASTNAWYLVQAAIMATAGLAVLLVPAIELYKRRDAGTLLLALWIWGTFIFTGFLNWGIGARFLLPLVPPVAILVARIVGERKDASFVAAYMPLLPALALSLVVAWADYTLAESARRAAFDIGEEYGKASTGRTLWFQGHWGFQYYMEELGAKALDMKRSHIKAGDTIIVPLNSSFTTLDMGPAVEFAREYRTERFKWLSTLSTEDRAGFYASGRGPLPYVFGRSADERYYIFRAARDISPG
jgi:4-amino-4-deoxy-L-arabinose transferase-like glycosyltransferase